MRDLRLAQLAAPPGTDTHPEKSEVWQAYRTKWFTPVHPCEGAECAVRQPPEASPGRYAGLGLDTNYNPTAGFFAVAARGTVLRYAEDINPFVYALTASLGYRHYNGGANAGFFGLGFEFVLPVGYKAAIGFTPAELRVVFGGPSDGSEVVTRLFRFNYALSERLFLSVQAPLEVNWRKPQAQWSFSLGVSYALSARRLVTGDTLLRHEEKAQRKDDEWVPPPAPYGRLQGRIATLYAISGISVTTPPADAVPGTNYGLGMLGAEMQWDRDRWGGRFALTPAVSLAAGLRRTSGTSKYFTGTFSLGGRWYFLGPLGPLSDGGPRQRGTESARRRARSTPRRASTALRGASTTCWRARGSASRCGSASSTSSSRGRRSPGRRIPSARTRSSASGSASG